MGYHALIKGGVVTVFGPDGAEIASGSRRDGVAVGLVGDTRLVSDGLGDRGLKAFAILAARHHRAAADPSVRDRVWVRWEEDGVAAVYGTDKYDDADTRAVKAGNLYWSGQRQARVTGRKWNPGTRDRNLAAVLLAFARQDRNIVVLGPGQTPEDLAASPTTAAAEAVPAQQASPVAEAPAPEPEPEPEPEDFTGLSYEELVEAENAAAKDRARAYTAAVEGRYRALREERGKRLLDRVATAAPVTEMGDEELAAEYEWWQENLYKTPFHSSGMEYRTLERRSKAVLTEQSARIAQAFLAGPAAADLDDEALESAHAQIGSVWRRLPSDHALNDQVADYRLAVQEERSTRRARSYGERTPVGEMALEDLIAEATSLGSDLDALTERSAYSYSEAVKEARAARLKAVEAEWFRRGVEQHPEAARATLGRSISGRRPVLIDGSVHTYGYVERQGKKFRALANWDERSRIGDFDSAPAAMAALVQRYDQDPETLPRRTWGLEREVDLPVSAHDPLVSWLRRRPSELSREYDRVLDILTPYQLPTRTKVANPLTNQVMQVYPFSFEEGLLGELARIAERTTEDLREQSLDDNLPKREREAAKRRIPTMGAALIGINAVIEQVRAAGGDVERRGVDQSRLAAQMAALAGTVNEHEGGEADGDDEPVRDAAAQALGGVPAAGTGGDAGPGAALPQAGGADERGDRRGGGGPGGGPGAGDGLPGPGRAAGADQGDGAGAGAARDAAAAGGRGQPGGAAESGSGGTGGDPQGAGEPVARFRPDPADLPRGPLARAEANLEAIKVLRTLESARRGATTEEKRVLARWSGWGSVPTVFLDEPDPDEPIYAPGGEWEGRFEADHARWESYDRVRGELRELLDPFEWRAASRAVLSAHYTPQAVAEAMWQGLAAYGFDGGEVLEAGCGSGAFFGVAPETARLTGVEVDPTTAAIAARIYPHANVLSESFTDTDAPVGTFDLVIGNVPFAQAPFGERRYGAAGHSLHNGFIIKQLALLRPGGYMAVITSRWTLDGEDTSARRAMSRWGDLAAAYRLPKGTFGETADTDVVADVLVFRRRAEGEEPGDQTWIDAPERELGGNTLPVNAYFTEHPENVLGRLTSETGPYGPRVTVQGDPGEAPRLLRERMEASAAAAIADGQGYVPHEDGPDRAPLLLQTAREKHATDFTGRLYSDDDGQIWQHVNGEDPIRVITADGASGTEQLRMLLSLRDTASELQELDRTGSDPDRAREVRSQLARLHTAYTTAHGPLSRPRQTRMALPTDEARAAARAAGVDLADDERLPTGWGWFRQDPHAAVVLGLEHWDRANDRPVPSEVLTRRPGARSGDLEPTDDPKTALSAVMGATGGVDLPLIASLLGTTPDEARHRLGTEVFDNPVTKKLEHAGAYLSGPVRVKLEEAREAAATDPTYAVNVAALEAVQPPPKRLGQFTAQLGAHWIPAPLVQGFLREYLGDPTLQVSHNERYGWSLAAGKVPDAINALKGTERRSAVHIAKALLGRASMVVNTLDGDGVDEDATRAMRYKADAMRSAFEDYCTASTARVTLLTDAYNRQMNGHVVRNYDGLAPTLAGLTTERTPHPWQLSAAARMQYERGVVLAHEVGLGKTTTMVMGSQALKASGQITKPFAVVQPHLARQWLDEAKLLYPNADIHLITSDDLADGNRRPVLEWLRANTPDLVIFTEGAFGSIRMSPEQQELYLFREIESLKEQLKRERGVPHNNFALMQLERRLTTVETRIRRNDAPMRTPGEVYWEDLGFDYALVDEAHRFTAVGFRSKEAGGEAASVRAVDLHQKLRWHHQVAEAHGGRPTVTLGTGTPMENSIFEQYSVLELATPWLLDQFGVHGPDLWSETFGQKVQRIEMAPDGSGLTIVERFSRFVSKSTMKTMWGLAADTKTGDDVGIVRPKLAGGAPELVLVEPTADQRARLQALVARGQAIHAGEVTRDEDNMLAVSGEGRAVALDPRLVDANAPAANKLVTAADIIAAGYHAHKDHTYAVSSRDDTPHPVPGGLFFVFCNSGTPGGNNKGGFDAYAELRDLLAARGVPRDMVQFAQDHATPEKKAAMSDAANNGGIAVLMGSTEVLGTGFNGQNRAYALMHLDQDWTPASMIQRNGRVIRPENQHEEVNIYFLATKGSMDAWQVGLLTSKAEGLRDIQRPPGEGDDDNDTVEEIGASDWDYATMAAEIGGNPFMRQFMEAKVHLQGLEADRRNAAADRVRQAELLLAKETELASTQRAIALRDTALPKVTATIRGDAFQIRVGGRDFDKRGEAGPVVRQAVADALRGHSSLGMGPWTTIGTFGGLDFAVRPEILNGGAEVRAHVGFPDLRHSESVCSIGDLANPKFGATIIGRLATALEKAEDHQLMDRERLPVLEAEIALLTAQQASVDYGPAIEHARRRVELLDAVVGAITERDKLPELTESMLDPKQYPTPESRQKAIRERAEQRAPHQAKVDQAAAALAAFDETTPAPERPTAPAPALNPAPTSTPATAPDGTAARPTGSSSTRPAGGAQALPEQAPPAPEDGSSTEEPPESQSSEVPESQTSEEEESAQVEASAVEDVTTLYAPGEQVRVTPMNYDTWSKTYVPQPEFIGTVISYTRNGNYMVREPEHGTSKHYDALRELHKLDTEPADSEVSPPTAEQRNTSQQPTESTPEQDSDGYGTANLYEEFGLVPPERVPNPASQDEPETDAEGEETDGVPDGQMTVEEAQTEAAPVGPEGTPPMPPEPSVVLATSSSDTPELADVEQPTPAPAPGRTRVRTKGSAAGPGAGTEQLGLFGDPAQDPSAGPAEPETTTGSGAVPAEDGREAQLRAALIEGETIAPVSFTDRREPVAGWILTTAGGHTFRLRPVTYAPPDEDQWEAGHDADGSYWWAANIEDRPLAAVLERIREDSATRTRFASLWARYGHLTAQAPQFKTTTDRVQLEEGVYLVRRFGRIGLIASCRWGWERLTDPDGGQGRTGEDWSRRGPDNRQYVAEWKIWNAGQEAIPNARLRVVDRLTDDMADTPDAYCDASQPYVGKCSAKRSGARYTVAVVTDQEVELGRYTVCARCLSHRLLNDENRHIGHRDVQNLVEDLAKGDPKVGSLHWKQWPDRIAEVAGQMLSAALDAGETAPWPAQALTDQILTEACEAGDDRSAREARAQVKAAGGDAKAQKRAAEEAVAARQDRAALVARRGATRTDAANETDPVAVAILELAGWEVEGSGAVPEPAEEAAPEVVNVNTLTVSPRDRNGEPSPYEFTVTGPGLAVGKYEISHDSQGKGARGIMWRATWHGVEPSGRWDVISIGSGEGKSAALAAVAEHATRTGGDLAAGFTVARRMHYDAGLWVMPEVGESEAIQYHPDGSWTITAATGALYTVRREWLGRTASGDLAPLLIEDQAGTLIASCTAVDSYMSAWAPMLDRLRLHATAVADGVPHATAVTLGGPGRSWVEAWCVCSWTERADVAEYAGRAPAGEALALAHRQAHLPETSAPDATLALDDVAPEQSADTPAAADLPELDVVLPDVDLATVDVAGPYETDEEAQADIDRLSAAFARWDGLLAVQRFYEADRQQRPDGQQIPTNPVAQLAVAYRDAERMLREGPAVSPDDLVLGVHTVAVWSGVLEPVVDEDLRGPLRQVREAAALLASRSRATVIAFEAELASLTANSEEETTVPESAAADAEPAEQPLADADAIPAPPTELGPGDPAASADGLGEPPAGSTPIASDTGTETVTDDTPAADRQQAPEPSAGVDDAPDDTAADSDPAPDRVPVPQDVLKPAGTVPDEGPETRREASFLDQDRPQTTGGGQQTPEPGTAAAPVAPAQAGEDAPSDETARDASEEPTMTTPPSPETTDAPDEPITEEPPAPQRYFETGPLAGDSDYRLRLSGLDDQPVDSGEVYRGDLVIATLHPGHNGGWFARLAAEPADVTYLADQPQEAAAHAAVMHSAFTGAPYGPPAGAAVGDGTRQRVDVLRAALRDAAVQHREVVALAAARAYPDFEQNEHFRALVGALDGLAAAESDGYGSQQMTQHLDAVQRAVNAWGGTLPVDPDHPVRRQLAFPLASVLYDSRRLQDQVQATLAAVQAERATVREQAAPTEPGPEMQPVPAAPADTGAPEEPTESQSPEVPDSQTSEPKVTPAAPAEPADAPRPEGPDSAAAPEDDGAALDSAVDGIRRALEDALQAAQPEASAQPGELPLWTGTEAPAADTAVTELPAGPLDVRAEFQAVLEAWEEHVPSKNGTAQDLVAELDAALATLQRAFAEAVAPAAPAAPLATADQVAAVSDESAEAVAPPSVPQQATNVNSALKQADTHATALQDLPEWQKIQTVRGAFGHLFHVMKTRAREYFDRLMGDHRVGKFFRKISIAACEKVAEWAQAAANRLRQWGERTTPDAPAADALWGVADTATAYASSDGSRSGPPPASRDVSPATVDIPAMRQLGEALARPLPGAKDGRSRVSTTAARGKSTTRNGMKKASGATKKPGSAAEQSGHLRRSNTDPRQGPKPTQR
ncbi:hypothetical protein [Streptomyces misionensis]|uniref:hypothetical protein n=1 Tax=Streptomyces misionensis TaxID=67331 RepID=UPI0033DFEAFE